MKRLLVKYLSLLLILAQTSVLFADTLTFNNGLKINGKLISISEEHELDPNTGVTSEVTFKVDDFQLKMISEELIVGKVDNSTLMFDKKSIYKITDDKGYLLFTNNKNLIGTTPPITINQNELDFFSTELILSNGNDKITIPQSSEINLFLNEAITLETNFVNKSTAIGALDGLMTAGPIGLLLGAAVYGATAAAATTLIPETQFQGIGINSDSQKYYFMTNKGVIEINNINKIEYVVSIENKAAEGFIIGAGIPLVIGGIILLSGDGSGNDAGRAFAGGILILASPILGILNAINKRRVPKIESFDINKGAWQIDIDSMPSKTK